MITIIAGDRRLRDFSLVTDAIYESGFDITEVTSGDAKGADWLGAYWGYLHGIPVGHFPANWKYLGKRAGPARNQVMADRSEALIALLAPKSIGTADMIRRARKANLALYIKYITF